MSNHSPGTPGSVRGTLIIVTVIVLAAVAIFLIRPHATGPESVPSQKVPDASQSSGKDRSAKEVSGGFVGSHACGECHSRQWAEWQSNPMYHSAQLTATRTPDEDYSSPEFSPAPHVKYRIEQQGHRLIHHELMVDERPEPIFDQAVDVQLVIGSGQQGHAYLIQKPGLLFASPINWYTKSSQWGLAPGYNPAGHQRFERRVTDACLSCHTGRVADDPEAKDRFLEPAFHELAIGCERCHGPGEQHVMHHRGSSVADVVVNPARLDPARRDAVCAQCHLQGVERIVRPDRTDFDFRPGQLIGEIWTIFIDQSSQQDGSTKAVSHVEQMQSSQCYIRSGGIMSCTTCHDPHSPQHGTQSADLYRSKCLTCHNNASCTAPEPDRTAKNDSCTACHMPAISASDVPHAVHTNHRILTRPQPQENSAIGRGSDLTIFQDGLVPLPDAESRRSLGITLARLAERGAISDSSVKAEQLLRQARASLPTDADLLECLGSALALQDRSFEAAAVWKQALRHDPRNEAILYRLAQLTHDNGAFAEAAGYLERFLQINPWHAGMYGRHAHVMGMLGRFPEGIRSAEKAIELDPSLVQVHGWLIEAYRMTGQTGAGERQKQIYDRLIRCMPPTAATQ